MLPRCWRHPQFFLYYLQSSWAPNSDLQWLNVHLQLCLRGTSRVTQCIQNSSSIIPTPQNSFFFDFPVYYWSIHMLMALISLTLTSLTTQKMIFLNSFLPHHLSFLHNTLQRLPIAVRLNTLYHWHHLTWMALICASRLLTCLSPALHRIPDILAFFLFFEHDKISPPSKALHLCFPLLIMLCSRSLNTRVHFNI